MTKICGFCGQRRFAPCGSSQQAENCGAMTALSDFYLIANTPHHPERLNASVALQEFHQELVSYVELMDSLETKATVNDN